MRAAKLATHQSSHRLYVYPWALWEGTCVLPSAVCPQALSKTRILTNTFLSLGCQAHELRQSQEDVVELVPKAQHPFDKAVLEVASIVYHLTREHRKPITIEYVSTVTVGARESDVYGLPNAAHLHINVKQAGRLMFRRLSAELRSLGTGALPPGPVKASWRFK